jgi:hypothetical protein
MSTFKDITYKKHDDETWAEWTKRVPDNDQDKRNYISDTIYVKIYENDEEKAGKITGMLLNLDVEELIVLLESNDLLEDKIKEEYQVLRELEEYQNLKILRIRRTTTRLGPSGIIGFRLMMISVTI